VNLEIILPAGKWQIKQFDFEPVTGLVIYEREGVVKIV
jgi:hypothetical protein